MGNENPLEEHLASMDPEQRRKADLSLEDAQKEGYIPNQLSLSSAEIAEVQNKAGGGHISLQNRRNIPKSSEGQKVKLTGMGSEAAFERTGTIGLVQAQGPDVSGKLRYQVLIVLDKPDEGK